MNLRNIASLYSIIIGIAMICMWITFLVTNQVPEINSAPFKISYHLMAEFLTSILLLIGGFGLYTKKSWGFHLYLISMGMLFYTVIFSAGYYADLGEIVMVGMFTVFQAFTLLFIGIALCRNNDFKD
jgi:peptidoglycan/LPS O-acetylase OafA/YrhL